MVVRRFFRFLSICCNALQLWASLEWLDGHGFCGCFHRIKILMAMIPLESLLSLLKSPVILKEVAKIPLVILGIAILVCVWRIIRKWLIDKGIIPDVEAPIGRGIKPGDWS